MSSLSLELSTTFSPFWQKGKWKLEWAIIWILQFWILQFNFEFRHSQHITKLKKNVTVDLKKMARQILFVVMKETIQKSTEHSSIRAYSEIKSIWMYCDYPPWNGGIWGWTCLSVCPSVCLSVRPSVRPPSTWGSLCTRVWYEGIEIEPSNFIHV